MSQSVSAFGFVVVLSTGAAGTAMVLSLLFEHAASLWVS